MATDGTYIYVAYYDYDNADLKLAKLSWNSGSPSVMSIKTIDAYLSAGSWTHVMLLTNSNLFGSSSSTQPVMAYYSDSYNGTKKPIRFAFPKFDAAGANSLMHGVTTDSGDTGTPTEYYSGNWEIMTVPAISAPKGGSATFNKVQLGAYSSSTLPVVGWAGDVPEYAKLMPGN
jgi:hypothetical protein